MLPALILSYGRTSILALISSLLVFFASTRRYRYLFLFCIIPLLIYLIDGYSYVQLFLSKGDSFKTLSGRLNNWPEAWTLFKESPIYGYGFYIASRLIFSEKIKIEYFSTTDNTYLDVLLSIGLIGFVPFVLVLYSFIKNILKNLSSQNNVVMRMRYEFVAVAIIIFFRSFTGPSIEYLHWNLIIFLAIIICSQSMVNFENSTNSQLS